MYTYYSACNYYNYNYSAHIIVLAITQCMHCSLLAYKLHVCGYNCVGGDCVY